jgi:uncharacterized protein YfaS (alpha-2-macroglobulin family)
MNFRNIFTRFSALASVLLILWACASITDTLSVKETNFTKEIDTKQNLVFSFNKDVAKPEQIEQWLDKEYIKITPAVPGKFKFTSPNTLVFSPENGFLPSSDFKAELTPALLENVYEKGVKLDEKKVFTFNTPYLSLKSTDMIWASSQSGAPQVNLNLRFNYPVKPDEVSRLLSIKLDGQDIKFQVLSTSETSNIKIALPEREASQIAQKALQISLSEGLSTIGNRKGEKAAFDTEIPAIDQFQILRATTERIENETVVRIYTNQAVTNSAKEIEKLVSISPSVGFTAEITDFGFLLKGTFAEGLNYTVSVGKNLKGVFGKTLLEDYNHYVAFGSVGAMIKFSDPSGMYLGSQGEKNIGVKIYGLNEVEFQVYKIYRNNVLHYLRQISSYLSYADSEYSYFYEGEPSHFGDLVLEKTVKVKDLPRNGEQYIVNMSEIQMKDKMPYEGAYLVMMRSTDDRWVRHGQIVNISDIGLMARRTKDEVLVFVNSLRKVQPIAGTEISLVTRSNQEIMKAKTNSDGIAIFTLTEQAKQMEPDMIFANFENEFSFMYFRQNAVATDRYDVGGLQSNQAGYQAYIYGQRELYRPGEKMFFKTVIRNDRWLPTANLPIKFDILLPNGKTFASKKVTTNEQGTYETEIQLPENAVTGAYTAQVSTANGVVLNTKNINIEDFMPQRIKVNSQMTKEFYGEGETVEVEGQAFNLFGPPAANRKYECELVLKAAAFRPDPKNKTLSQYDFSMRYNREVYLQNIVNEGTTDEQGKFSETFEIPEEYAGLASIEGKIWTVVFDETGRPVGNTNTFRVYTQKQYFGIKHLDGYWFATGSALSFPIVAVNRDGKALVSAKARVVIIRKEWETVLESGYYGDDYRYVSREREYIEREQIINITATGTSLTYVPTRSGYYEVRVYDIDSPKDINNRDKVIAYASSSFYAYAWGNATASSFQVDKEGEVKIVLDKEVYSPGDKAKVLFNTPFKGRMMVTIERDKVYDYFFVNTDERSASLEIPIKPEYLPNFYVSATLIRPIESSNLLPLTVAHGYQNAKVEDKSSRISIEIAVVEKSRSNTKQEISFKTNKPDAELTIAVVDEGIMQIKNQKTPDPHGYFYQKRALEVWGFDLYKRLLPEVGVRGGRYGADGYDLNGRHNPLSNRRVKPFAVWSGTIKTDKNGAAKFTVDIPQFSGEARVMAVAVKDNAFGSSEAKFKVADPIVISAGVPRFMSPEDIAAVPVTLTNTTASAAEAVVKLETNDLLTVTGSNTLTVSIPANSEKQVFFNLAAKPKIGESEVNVKVTALGETFNNKTELTVRPSVGLLKESSSGELEGGKEANIVFSAQGFLPGTTKGKLIVSRSPLIRFSKNLSELIAYPHGCLEQTISTAFPQLYLSDISKVLGSEITGTNEYDPNWNVRRALSKLQSLQLYTGGLAYWPGDEEANWWGSIYAAHFIIEAKKAGFDVDKYFYSSLLDYIRYRVTTDKTEDTYYMTADNRRIVKKQTKRQIIYGLYVLALAGKKDISTMNYYKANPATLTRDSQYLLAVTYKILGDTPSYNALLPTGFGNERSDRAFDGSFYSPLRDKAIVLNALIDTDPDNPQNGILAKQVAEDLRNQRYVNTQENAFALLALGKLARKANASNATATVTSDGGVIGNFTGETLVLKDKNFQNLKIKTEGSGTLYYFWEASGISATGAYKEADNFIKVRREFYDRYGNMVRTPNFKQNDLIVVRVSLQTTNNSEVPNVVLTDMLPAGLEVENPRLSGDRGYPWVKDAQSPAHIDFRDDRINMFVTATPTPKHYYYIVRAVSKGTYKLGPVSADAMYNGEYHSYHGGGTLKID